MERIDSLGPCKGRAILDTGTDGEAVPAERFFEPEFFAECIARNAGIDRSALSFEVSAERAPGSVDMRAYVSRFVRHYAGSVSIAALVGLAEGIGLDMAASRCALVMWKTIPYRLVLDSDDDSVVRSNERPTSWSATGPVLDSLDELRAHVWRSLYGEHLAPFVAQIADATNLSPALLWTNVAERVAIISELAREYLGEDAALPYMDDRRVLLESDRLPGVTAEANPLRERLDWTPVNDGSDLQEVANRRLCCLSYLLHDRFGRLCSNCPHLPVEEKVALIRERHGQPVEARGGEARNRAIERGLQRPSVQRLLQEREHRPQTPPPH